MMSLPLPLPSAPTATGWSDSEDVAVSFFPVLYFFSSCRIFGQRDFPTHNHSGGIQWQLSKAPDRIGGSSIWAAPMTPR